MQRVAPDYAAALIICTNIGQWSNRIRKGDRLLDHVYTQFLLIIFKETILTTVFLYQLMLKVTLCIAFHSS